MKIGELRRFTHDTHLCVNGQIFFINNIIEDDDDLVCEVVIMHNGKKILYTHREILYYSKVIESDKKCP